MQSTEKALDARARRAARRVGLVARKSRRRIKTSDNLGGYMLLHAIRNYCVRGSRCELSAEYVIEFCKARREAEAEPGARFRQVLKKIAAANTPAEIAAILNAQPPSE